jgi:methylenetetrahydrofolate dehydrogenase (NADP+) / methenyltetrahydrofolate cyclohydrolase
MMSARILAGNQAAQALLEGLKPKIKQLNPKLVIVQVGQEAASESYIKRKIQTCADIGLRHSHLQLPFDSSFENVLEKIEELNADQDVTGYIVQLPLPPHLQRMIPLILRSIDPRKDADGFTAYNIGNMFLDKECENLPPATPAGIIALLEYYRIPVEGKHIVIVGRSNIVGKPLAIMLVNRNATVTVCHSKTVNMKHQTLEADILVSAVGKPNMITADMVKHGAVVIDVGINRNQSGEIVGDVDFDAVKNIASAITPVPGGIGPMTVAHVIANVVHAKERQQKNV